MEYRVKGRIPVGRLRKAWLGSVEADMTELEIDKEDSDSIFRMTLLGYYAEGMHANCLKI